MGNRDVGEQLDAAIEYAKKLEGQLTRIENALESPVDDKVKVSLVSKIVEGH